MEREGTFSSEKLSEGVKQVVELIVQGLTASTFLHIWKS